MLHNEKTELINNNIDIANDIKCKQIIEKIMEFLRIFMCDTLVKRILSIILIAVGLPNACITDLTGLCDRSVRSLRKELNTSDNDIASLFIVKGGGRKRKLKDVESDIIEEINNNNYHSRQEIADMILEKFGIKISLPAVGRLLKKTMLGD